MLCIVVIAYICDRKVFDTAGTYNIYLPRNLCFVKKERASHVLREVAVTVRAVTAVTHPFVTPNTESLQTTYIFPLSHHNVHSS